ncbi:MAG TPA: hypothetical protein PL045_11740, partial [Chitinophagaceae bacterium]|nr:hypothetical protein [Chitinophagaceae bacterium]
MPTSYRKHAALIFLLLLLADCKIFSQINNQHTSIFQRIGPGGGGATFLPTFSYHSPNNFFIRCDMTGSYLTNDGGESYLQFNFDNGAASYAFDPHNAQIIYAGSVVLNRSIDGSKTWQQVFPKASEISSAKYRGDHAEYEIETASTSLYEAEYSQIKNIKVDPTESNTVYFSMGNYFFYTADDCNTFQRLQLYETIDCIYTSKAFKDEVYICTASAIHIFNKHSHIIQQRELPEKMSPAFSFCGGTKRNSNKLVLYALHYTNDAPILNQYNHSEVWTSDDNGNTWHRLTDSLLTGNHQSLPNFSRIVCAEFDAASVYLISDLYEE